MHPTKIKKKVPIENLVTWHRNYQTSCNTKVNFRTYKRLLPNPIISRINPVRISTSRSFNIHFDIITTRCLLYATKRIVKVP
jgi:hypothetical protein